MTPKQKTILEIVGVITLFAVVSIILQFSSPNIADPDGFYHIRHAYIYRTQDLFDSSFPWTQFSVIKKYGADIWYGFHIFLIPFTYFKDLVFGIKVAGVFVTLSTFLTFWWALKRLEVIWPWLWPILLVTASPDLMYRLTMTRPHSLTLGLSLLIFSFLIKGKPWPILLASALTSFIHLALSWIPILIILIITLARKIHKLPVEWAKVQAMSLGLLLGLLARPNPLEALKLAYTQVVQILFVKINEIPLYFGRELKGLEVYGFIQNILPALIILALTFFLYARYVKKQTTDNFKNKKVALTDEIILITIFLIVTLTIARRGYDILVGHILLASSLMITAYLNSKPHHKKILLAIGIILIGSMSVNSIPTFKIYMANAWKPSDLKEVSLWLKENTKPGEIVFNTRWDNFHGLFFWNPNNYYIGGMDPIFQYAYNKNLYWKGHFLATDKADKLTCGKIRCTQEEAEDTHTVLVKDFGASYLMLKQSQNPKLYFYLVRDGKFPLVFDNSREAVFKVPPL